MNIADLQNICREMPGVKDKLPDKLKNQLGVMIVFLSFALFTMVPQFANAQTVNLITKATLPPVLTESSGLESTSRNSIWSHNDSGGNPQLYCFDSTGVLLRTLNIQNATNVDWEDLAQDSIGNFYIADIGNNNNNRKDLKIYKIQNPQLIPDSTTTAGIISFSYPEQTAFPPADSLKDFDAEAIIAFHDSIFLFTKNRTTPYNGYTYLYKIPSVAGTYSAERVDSFYTGPGPFFQYSVTAADISPDYRKLILLAGDRCWLFSNFTGRDFFKGTAQELHFTSFTQKEGVCFISNTEIYISDEFTSPIGQKLYYLDLEPYLATNIFSKEEPSVSVAPVPFLNGTLVTCDINDWYSSHLSVYDISGQTIFSEDVSSVKKQFILDERVFKDQYGFFFLELATNEKIIRRKLLRLR